MLRRLVSTAGGALALAALAACSAREDPGTSTAPAAPAKHGGFVPPKPNVVLLVADDLGWSRVGYHGSRIETPHIDSLAAEGVELDRFYAAPICVATRAGLLTGRYPIRFGMQLENAATSAGEGLPASERTLAELFGKAGYERRGLIGKWHLGAQTGVNHPLDVGFTHFYGNLHASVDYFTHRLVRSGSEALDWHRGRELVVEEGYATDLLAREACAFIESSVQAEQPFLLYLPFQAVHAPHSSPERYAERFTDQAPSVATISRMVACMDDAVGEVLRTLETTGQSEHTIVWFLADNGGGGGEYVNRPLRGEKATVSEGGIRVPSAVRWPAGGWSGGRRSDALLAYIDVLPTLLTAVGARRPKNLDGLDVGPVLAGAEPTQERVVYSAVQAKNRLRSAINTPQWKLVHSGRTRDPRPGDRRAVWPFRGGAFQLYRIDTDPGERENLVAQEPELVDELSGELATFLRLIED